MKMKASIYEIAVWLAERGARFYVRLEERSLKLNGKYIIREGKWNQKHPLHNFSTEDCQSPLSFLTQLYREYKYSRPTERSMSQGRHYFTALKERDLEDEDMMFGMVRDVAQLRLELAVLALILDGSFQWNEETMGKWFWQSSTEKDFVILREWTQETSK